MNKLCDVCAHQRKGNSDSGVVCDLAKYITDQGYGPFKQGSVCIYDSDLKPLFEHRTGQEANVRLMSQQIDKKENELRVLGAENSRLRERLVRFAIVDKEASDE